MFYLSEKEAMSGRILCIAWIILLGTAVQPLLSQAVLVEDEWSEVFVPRILNLTFVDESQALALSQEGEIYRLDLTQSPISQEVVLDLSDEIGVSAGERGLLGLAVHPDYPMDPRIFINHTESDPSLTTVVRSFEIDPEDLMPIPGSDVELLRYAQPFDNHNGGHITFGPDGYLYISSGDGGSSGDPMNNAQDTSSWLGKILRIDVDGSGGGLAYDIPEDNPFVGGAGRDEIYAWGVRNPWRFSFDRETGEFWAADVGQGAWECIHVIQNGKNYGWRILEGSHCFMPSSGCDSTGLELPIFEYNHSQGDRSITGGYMYRGKKQPLLYRKYVYGDFVSGRIWALEVTPDALQVVSNEELMNTDINVSAFAEDLEGEVYVLTYGSGGVRRLVVEPPAPSWTDGLDTVYIADKIRWTAEGAEVDEFVLEISRDSSFTDLVYNGTLTDTFFHPGVEFADLQVGHYYSRLRAENRAGQGEVSQIHSWYYADDATSVLSAFSAEDVLLYPNPTSDVLRVEWPEDFSVWQYIIRNAHGQVVMEGTGDFALGQLRLDVRSLPTGSYALGLIAPEGQALWRMFVVE